jgi:CheY-like chemotaxis protein
MSHELRTPLNAILGYAQILKNAENLNERQIQAIHTIQSSGEHLLSMINEILDLSKIEAGRTELQIKALHLHEFLKSLANMLQIRAKQQGIIFRYEQDPALPVGVFTDERRLREVLINLLSNAVKFTKKGSVTFRVKKLDTGYLILNTDNQHPAASIHFEVEDTGIGIAPEHLEEIFLPFRQVGEQYAIEGTGLGLAISQQLVRAMGGELSVQSTVGKGSLFWFKVDFPGIPGFIPESPPHAHNIQGYRGERRTVLITDDKPENRLMLVDMLLPLGFHILEAENGQECLEKTLQHRPDMILLDIRMPIMNGFEVTRQIRTLDEIHNITIIAVTASVFEERRKQILEAGCDAYLAKPFRVEDLLHLLQTYLHLEWIYAEDIGESMNTNTLGDLEPGQSVELPPNHINNLLAFAERGSLTKILTELDTIEHLNAEYAPVVHQLRRLTKHFRFDDIITLLKQETH